MGAPERRLLDERDYLAREAAATSRHEHVGGIVYAMAGAGERHNRIAGNLFVTLRLAVRGTSCGASMAVIVDSERIAVTYYVRERAEGDWLAATLDPGERLSVQCDGVGAELTQAGIYEDTGLPVP